MDVSVRLYPATSCQFHCPSKFQKIIYTQSDQIILCYSVLFIFVLKRMYLQILHPFHFCNENSKDNASISAITALKDVNGTEYQHGTIASTICKVLKI